MYAIRVSRTSSEPYHALQRPALCIVTQGAKTVLLGQEVYEYDTSRMLVYSVDLPVAGQVTKAIPAEPYLSVKLDLDPQRIAELVPKVYPHGLPRASESRGVCVSPINLGIVNAAARLLELMAYPGDVELLAPPDHRGDPDRLLKSPIRIRVAHIGLTESPALLTPGRLAYDLRGLRLHGLIVRIPKTHRYQVTPFRLRLALFGTRVRARLLRPGAALLTAETGQDHSALRGAFDRLERVMDTWCTEAKLVA